MDYGPDLVTVDSLSRGRVAVADQPGNPLDRHAGYEQVYDIDEIITQMSAPEEIERLEIAPGTPVAEHIRTGYARADQAVRAMISIIPCDTLILEYKIPS